MYTYAYVNILNVIKNVEMHKYIGEYHWSQCLAQSKPVINVIRMRVSVCV